LGLELSGAKNPKTALATIQFYPKERKAFLLDIYERISGHDHQSGDEALLEVIQELAPKPVLLAVNVPLELPPCISCSRKHCPLPHRCSVPTVQWMRETTRKASKSSSEIRVKEFTPYTQRPVEIWNRYHVLPTLDPSATFEIDETLGGNRAPLAARMNFLKRHLGKHRLIEAWPKLTIAMLAQGLGLSRRTLSSYRHLEEGAHARAEILEKLVAKHAIFIYERDQRKLSHSLTAFDAFLCAYTALLCDRDQCVKPPRGFPIASGWVEHPRSEA